MSSMTLRGENLMEEWAYFTDGKIILPLISINGKSYALVPEWALPEDFSIHVIPSSEMEEWGDVVKLEDNVRGVTVEFVPEIRPHFKIARKADP